MPTPSDDTTVLHTPPPASVPSSPRASFASCPPDPTELLEERDLHLRNAVMREARVDSPQLPHDDGDREPMDTAEERVGEEQMMRPEPRQQPTPEAESDTMTDRQAERAEAEESERRKGGPIDDAEESISAIASSPNADALSDSDAAPASAAASRLAQSMSTTAISGTERAKAERDETEPLYLTFPRDRTRSPPTITSSFLRPGSKFRGTQQSDRQVYDVQVEIKDVNMAESFLCGYLRIQGLTDDHPTLTTFFEGEIIGPKHLFKTTHPSWGSSEKVDLQHWARFPAWRPLAKTALKSPSFTLKKYPTHTSSPPPLQHLLTYFFFLVTTSPFSREHIFMRWKEYFLVPDHRVKTITGASFEGFYYICFNQVKGSVSGIYFHAKSEKYQQLELRVVRDGGCEGALEFR
ncbi:Glucose-induced degradation protein 4 [Teratosphaeria destructans]|uniref:Glucose-induced degradation protein 4 n=1 Tax=Teratosphaeria destructans TaxID=418781 RepID=A0A9W7T1S0_9PEZI|nr:Glucose-induced degradation protein 4 [Teratosphaeria destructans]